MLVGFPIEVTLGGTAITFERVTGQHDEWQAEFDEVDLADVVVRVQEY